MSEIRKIEYIHTKALDGEEYFKEIYLTGLNQSVVLKSNIRTDTLKSMIDLGIKALIEIKKMEEK